MVKAEVLHEHASEVTRRVETLVSQNDSMQKILDNEFTRNGKLNLRASGVLKITQLVTVAPLEFVPDPLNEGQIGRFAWGFHMAERYDGDARVPITTDTLLKLPKTYELDVINRSRDHRSRPTYYRALALFPSFFVSLTTEVSDSAKPPAHLGPELYIAYNVMSRLIDAKDPGVIKPDGTVDRSYLFRPRPKIEHPHLRSAG